MLACLSIDTNRHCCKRALLPAASLLLLILPTTGRAQFAVMHTFTNGGEGDQAYQRPIQASDGNLYGVTSAGGASGFGTVYRLDPKRHEWSVLHAFAGASDSDHPSSLIQGSDGYLYGTCGGRSYNIDTYNDTGTVFKIALDGSSFQVLHTFSPMQLPENVYNADGATPGGLMQAADGNLYGSCASGDSNSTGNLFSIHPDGTGFIILHTFGPVTGAGANGVLENADGIDASVLIQASDGNLYGGCFVGGANGAGTLIKLSPGGSGFTAFYTFGAPSEIGESPFGGLIQGSNGYLYGTCAQGGGYGGGIAFKVSLDGSAFTVLHIFPGLSDGGPPTNTDGAIPQGGMIEGSDGNLYGTASEGGPNGTGFTVIYVFSTFIRPGINTDGSNPFAGLTEAADGDFYGVTAGGGSSQYGTIFRLAPAPADFNHSGKSDLLLQNPATGQLAVWYMNGIQPIDGAFIPYTQAAGWAVVGAADLDKDGWPDILFQNSSTGQLAVWFMHSISATAGALIAPVPPAGWKVVGIADFNQDGYPDILLQSRSTGQLAVWYMQGTTVLGGAFISPTPSQHWTAVGAADFNKDGWPDILFQNSSTGQLAVWYLNDTTAVDGGYLNPAQNPVWQCVGVLNGNGGPNLLFQSKNTGQLVYWTLNGTTAVDGNYLSAQPPSGWQVAAPH